MQFNYKYLKRPTESQLESPLRGLLRGKGKAGVVIFLSSQLQQ